MKDEIVSMKCDKKYLWVAFISAFLGSSLVFTIFSCFSNKHGTLAEWISGIGTIAAILFVYWQIDEQRKEFQLSKKYSIQIAFIPQVHYESTKDGGKLFENYDYYIWAVNDGMAVGSFKFLGFCRKDEFNKIRTEDVIFDPKNNGLNKLLPHPTNKFELLHPGEVSEEIVVNSLIVLEGLRHPNAFYVIYMDALGKIYKKEIVLEKD